MRLADEVEMEPQLPSELVHAIGSVVLAASRLEVTAAVVMWACYPVEQQSLRRLPDTPDDFRGVTEELKLIARTRLTFPTARQMADWVVQARQVMDRRNRVAHGAWTGPADERGRFLCGSPRRLKGAANSGDWYPTVQDVRAIASALADQERQLHRLLPGLVRDIPYAASTILVDQDPPPTGERFVGRPGPATQ